MRLTPARQLRMSDATFQWIDSDKALNVYCQQIGKANVLAVDTEFIRRDTFYAQLALIQIYDGKQAALIDPLRISQWAPLVLILESQHMIKVMHAGAEDLEILWQHMAAAVAPVFDSQIAAAFVGLESGLSYDRLAQEMLGLSIDKSATRSDWMKRPLTVSQQQYAVGDVLHLFDLYHALKERMQSPNVMPIVLEHGAYMLTKATHEVVDYYYLKLTAASGFDDAALQCLRWLMAWREMTMREVNRPRNKVMTDHHAVRLIAKAVSSMANSCAYDLWQAVVKLDNRPSLQAFDVHALGELMPLLRPLSKASLKRFKQRKARVMSQLGIKPELLGNNYDDVIACNAWVNADVSLDVFMYGWRLTMYQQVIQ